VGILRHARMAASTSDAVRRQVTSTDVPPEPFASALRSAEAPPWQVEGPIEGPARMVPSYEPSRAGHNDVPSLMTSSPSSSRACSLTRPLGARDGRRRPCGAREAFQFSSAAGQWRARCHGNTGIVGNRGILFL
jgi:hypothetical protein